jgi:hypothetical protein
MKAILLEHRNLIITGVGALVSVGACGYFLYQSQTSNTEAFEALRSVSNNLSRIQSATPTPSKENLDALKSQREQAAQALEQLRTRLKGLDLPATALKPPEFQKVLNERSQAIAKLAEVNGVAIPANFYFGFSNYTKTVPKDEATPQLGRQLQVAELICKQLIQTVPSELKSFERSELESEKDPAAAPKEEPLSKDKEKSKGKDAEKDKLKASRPPTPPTFESSFFRLRFVTRPGPLREFLNALASEKSCILVTRNLKIENEKQKGPSKRGPEELNQGNALAPNPSPTSLSTPQPLDPFSAAGGAAPSAGEVSQFIVGDEKIEVTLRVEFVSFLEEPSKEPAKKP